MTTIIGKIDNGLIIKESFGEGYFYNNPIAFENKEGICYVPEFADEEEIKVTSTVEQGAYTYQDFLKLAGGNEKVARTIFDGVTWEYPETYLEQSDYLIKCDKCNWVYDEDEVENPQICPNCHTYK